MIKPVLHNQESICALINLAKRNDTASANDYIKTCGQKIITAMSQCDSYKEIENEFKEFKRAQELQHATMCRPPDTMAQLLVVLNWFDKVVKQGGDTQASSVVEQLAGVFRGLPNLVKDHINQQLQVQTTTKTIFTEENVANAKSILGLANRNKKVETLSISDLQVGQKIALDVNSDFVLLKVIQRKAESNEVIVSIHSKKVNGTLVLLNIDKDPPKVGSALKGKILAGQTPVDLGTVSAITLG